MVLLVKHKFSIYKKYKLDIWGLTYTTSDILSLLRKRNHKLKPIRWRMRKLWFTAVNDGIQDMPILHLTYLRFIPNLLLRFFFKLFVLKKRRRRVRFQRYVFRLDTREKWFKRKRWNKRFVSIRITRLYFINLQDYQFRKLFRKAAKLSGHLSPIIVICLNVKLCIVSIELIWFQMYFKLHIILDQEMFFLNVEKLRPWIFWFQLVVLFFSNAIFA